MKKVIILLVSIALISLAGYQLYNNKKYLDEKATPMKVIKNVTVETVIAKMQEFKDELNLSGTFIPNKEVRVLSETNGKVLKLFVKEGDFVSEGKLIAQVDHDIISAQLMAATANLEKLQKDLARMENLFKSNAATDVQLQEVKLGVKSAESNVTILKKQLSNTNITAPISGVISMKMIETGSVLNPGAPVVVITDVAKVKLNVMVPERELTKIKDGQKVGIKVDAFGENSFVGMVTLMPVKSNTNQMFPVEITVNNGDKSKLIRAGMYGRAIVSQDNNRTSIALPRTALIGSIKNPQVYIVKDGKAYLKSIKVSESDKEMLEVLSGLNENDIVVVNGQINLSNAVDVNIASK